MNMTLVITIVSILILVVFIAFMLGIVLFHSRQMIQKESKIKELELERAKRTLINTIEIQEAERSRIGADIHDDLGPLLSVMKLKINNIYSDSPSATERIEELKIMIEQTIKDVRSLSHSLYPSTLERYGLSEALQELASKSSSTELKVVFDIDRGVDSVDFYKQINIYRIVQEFVNNCLKHSNCENIELKIQRDDTGLLTVHIEDDGSGFDLNDQVHHGIGIKNMRMRAETIDFDIDLTSTPGIGTSLRLTEN